jgi:hypothetical protein
VAVAVVLQQVLVELAVAGQVPPQLLVLLEQ